MLQVTVSPTQMGINNKGDFLASVTGISRDGAGFRNGSNQQLSDIIKDRGSFCPSLCHPSISFVLRPAFLLAVG